MKQILPKKHWFLGAGAVLALSVAIAGISAARAVVVRPAPSQRMVKVPMPALDRAIAKLAGEARARTLADNSR
jgi:hypothetical protein